MNIITNILVVVFVIWLFRRLASAIEKQRTSNLVRISISFNSEAILSDFLPGLSGEQKDVAISSLEIQRGYSIYRNPWSRTSLVFYNNGGVGVSLYDKVEIKKKDNKDSAWLRLFISNGNIKCTLLDENVSFENELVFKFPLYPLDEYLMKSGDLGSIRKLPSFLDEHLKKYKFELRDYSLKSDKTFEAYGSEWVEEDYEIRSDHHPQWFSSKYVTIAITSFQFSSDELSPLEKDLMIPDSFTDRDKDDNHNEIIRQITKLK